MTGARKLKSVCFKCKVNKWAVDFRKGCYSQLSSLSVCLACEQNEKILLQTKEIELLKTRDSEKDKKIEDLEKQVLKMKQLLEKINCKKEESAASNIEELIKILNAKVANIENRIDITYKENREDIVETGQQVVEIRKEIASIKDKNDFRVVKGRKSKMTDRKESIPLVNKFAVLKDENEIDEKDIGTYVIGTSIVREQKFHFGMKNNRQRERRIVKSFPGCKVKKVIQEVNALKVKNKKVCVIANAGGNDLFGKNNEVGQSEPIIKDLKNLVDSLANKSKKGMLIGILPRRYASHYGICEAIAINDQISKYCVERNVNFVDVWNIFYGHWHFFNKDGIHLNNYGHRKLSELMHQGYDKVKGHSCDSATPSVQPPEVKKVEETEPSQKKSEKSYVEIEKPLTDLGNSNLELEMLFREDEQLSNFEGFPN